MTERTTILSAKVEKLAEIVEDGNRGKKNPPNNASEDDVKGAQSGAVKEVIEKGKSVKEIKDIKLPSDRV